MRISDWSSDVCSSDLRTRKLLLHKDEIIKISHAVSAGGYTLVPLRLYFSDGRAKVENAVAKGKREFEKRQTIRESEDKREAESAMRPRNRLGAAGQRARNRASAAALPTMSRGRSAIDRKRVVEG